MAERHADEAIFTGWRATCCALAVPLVYLFGNDIYAAVGILIGKSTELFGENGLRLLKSLYDPEHPPAEFTFSRLLLGLFVGVPLGLFFLAVLLIVFVPLEIVAWIMQWLITTAGGDFHTIAHLAFGALLVLLFGNCLYLLVFPLLWVVTAPILAATFGELTYLRLRRRVYGDRARFARPLSLLVGLLSVSFGAARLIAPVVAHGAQAWRAEVKQVYFPPTPGPSSPPAWPKHFAVAPKQVVHTKIFVTGKSQEVYFWTTAHMFFKIGSGPWTLFRRNAGQDTTAFSQARTGEILLQGGDEAATVSVGQPQFRGRKWLAPGETLRIQEWVDVNSTLWYCGEGDLSLRTLENGQPSSEWIGIHDRRECQVGWGGAVSDGEKAPGSGFLEVKAGGNVSWFNFVSATPQEQWFSVPAGRVLETTVPVRRGDRVRVAAGSEVVYLIEGAREVLISGGHFREEMLYTSGMVRLKGGVLDSRAAVTVLARGSEWK